MRGTDYKTGWLIFIPRNLVLGHGNDLKKLEKGIDKLRRM